MSYDAILFDFDGVLVEMPSPEAMYDALRRTHEAFNASRPDPNDVREFVRGDFEAIAARCRRLGIDTNVFCAQAAREMIHVQRRELERDIRSVYNDTTALRSLGPPLGLVSDNHPAVLSMVLDRIGLRSLFEVVYGCPLTRGGLERRKPNPDNITAAMATLEVDTALYVGDRPVDVRAAHNAGIDSALVSRGEDRADIDATYLISSLRELSSIVE